MSGRNLSLKQKSAARLAAVQCLYRLRMDDSLQPAALLADVAGTVDDHREGDKEIISGDEPDLAYLKKLLNGVYPLLVALVQMGMYELKHIANLKPAVVIDEYTTLTRGFFEEDEASFVHGILYKLAGVLRS
jgi:transcription termination factor NusB